MLINVLPATKAKMRVLDAIYDNMETSVRGIIRLAKVSPNLAVSYIKKLEEYGLVRVKNIGGTRKSYIKSVTFNFSAELSPLFYTVIEVNKKERLISKYALLKPFVSQIENLKSCPIVLIYGSYARFAADKDSDLDLWVVGKVDERIRRDIEEILVTCPVKYSVTAETEKEFLRKIKTPIHQNILRDNVVIANEEGFFRILAGHYAKP